MTVIADVTEAEADELAKLAAAMGVPFARMAGAAIRSGLEKGVGK